MSERTRPFHVPLYVCGCSEDGDHNIVATRARWIIKTLIDQLLGTPGVSVSLTHGGGGGVMRTVSEGALDRPEHQRERINVRGIRAEMIAKRDERYAVEGVRYETMPAQSRHWVLTGATARNSIVFVFPGGAGTLQELATLANLVMYPDLFGRKPAMVTVFEAAPNERPELYTAKQQKYADAFAHTARVADGKIDIHSLTHEPQNFNAVLAAESILFHLQNSA